MQNTAGPPGLVVHEAAVATPVLYDHAIFWDGAYRKALIEGWLSGQGSEHFLD